MPKNQNNMVGVRFADDLNTLEALRPYICSEAIGRKTKVRGKVLPEVCQNCEVQCGYGRKYLRILREKQGGTTMPTMPTVKPAAVKPVNVKEDPAYKKLEAEKLKVEKRLKDAEASWQTAVEHGGELTKKLEQAIAENEDLRETVSGLVKEKAMLMAKLKDANQKDAELERILKELDYEKAERRKQKTLLNALKARLWDMEHPNADEI